MDSLRSFFRLLFAGKLGVGRVGRFFRLEENTQQNRRPAGNHIEVQLTRTNSSVFLNGSWVDLTASFVFCLFFCLFLFLCDYKRS